jgi:4-hydroxymandelate oxidase
MYKSNLSHEALLNLDDYERYAKSLLPKAYYDYYASGACDEVSLRLNREAYQQILLTPRVLRDISHVSLQTTLNNKTLSHPICIAPTAFHGLAHEQAEVATVLAANATQTYMTVSMMSNESLEKVAEIASQPLWLQLYFLNNPDDTLSIVRRAEAAGYNALVVTVDSQFLGKREIDYRNQFKLPEHLRPANLDFHKNKINISAGKEDLFVKKLTWTDIEWLKSQTSLPIWLKGILHPDDAHLALQAGVDGLIISNHGARQLDTAIPPILVLSQIAEVIAGQIPIIIDGGIRRGTDVFKAIALGANAIMLGRPILWGLAVAGSQGVEQVITILCTELANAMALCGFNTIQEIRTDGKFSCYIPTSRYYQG